MDGIRSAALWRTDIEQMTARFQHADHVLKLRLPVDLQRRRLVDLGCGVGNIVMAAQRHGFDQAIGIDANLRAFEWFEPREFPSICREFHADPRRCRLIEGDVYALDLPPADLVTMIDVIEHVLEPAKFIARAAELVAPGGCLLIDTAPLFYSPHGHHLFDRIPAHLPWQHLRRDFDVGRLDAWAQTNFLDLNRVTHDEIEAAVRETGLVIEQVHRDAPSDAQQAALEEWRPELELTGVDERWLFEGWIMLVARRSS